MLVHPSLTRTSFSHYLKVIILHSKCCVDSGVCTMAILMPYLFGPPFKGYINCSRKLKWKKIIICQLQALCHTCNCLAPKLCLKTMVPKKKKKKPTHPIWARTKLLVHTLCHYFGTLCLTNASTCHTSFLWIIALFYRDSTNELTAQLPPPSYICFTLMSWNVHLGGPTLSFAYYRPCVCFVTFFNIFSWLHQMLEFAVGLNEIWVAIDCLL